MNLFELRRVSMAQAIKIIAGYFSSKILRRKLIEKQNMLLYYFQHLVRLKIYHKKDIGKYFIVESPIYGRFYLRKPFSSDYKVFRQVFTDNEYLRLADIVNQNCETHTISMIDGGANIGLFTIFMHQFFKDKKRIVSVLVEPFEDNIVSARLNIASQGMDSVFYEMAGLHNKKCFLKIDQEFRDGKEWSVQIIESDEKTDLSSIEINEILDKYHFTSIDVLKLDIEGAERFLFEDEMYASNFLKKVKIIALELHDEYHVEDKIVNILKKNNFEVIKFKHTYIGTKSVEQGINKYQ